MRGTANHDDRRLEEQGHRKGKSWEAVLLAYKAAARAYLQDAASIYRELFGVGFAEMQWRRFGSFAAYAERTKDGLKFIF